MEVSGSPLMTSIPANIAQMSKPTTGTGNRQNHSEKYPLYVQEQGMDHRAKERGHLSVVTKLDVLV